MLQHRMAAQDRDRARFDARRTLASSEPPDHDPGPLAPVVGLARLQTIAHTIPHREPIATPVAA